jgi:hypothetical protein
MINKKSFAERVQSEFAMRAWFPSLVDNKTKNVQRFEIRVTREPFLTSPPAPRGKLHP